MRKRSTAVPLFMLGTLVAASLLGGCDDDDEQDQAVQQQTYKSLEDCQADWGTDASECQPDTTVVQQRTVIVNGQPTMVPYYLYMGPRYYYDHDSQRPMIITRDGQTRNAAASAFVSRPGAAATSARSFSVVKSSVSMSRGSGGSMSIARGGFGSSHGGGSEGG